MTKSFFTDYRVFLVLYNETEAVSGDHHTNRRFKNTLVQKLVYITRYGVQCKQIVIRNNTNLQGKFTAEE